MRLVTWNIHKGIGGADRRYSLGRIQTVLAELAPDLICMQEVAFDMKRLKAHDQAHLLAEGFPDHTAFFQPTVHWKKGGGYGNVILSRWPIVEQHRISLQHGIKKPRGAQLAVIETPSGLLRLVHWHLGLTEVERMYQVDHLLRHDLWRQGAHHPTLLVGDTNDWRNRLGAAFLEPEGLHQATAPPSRFRSFPAWMPALSLDKLFHTPNLSISHAHAVKSQATRQASDHLPVMAEVDWAG